jgi:HK97 family phage major capsid protein
VDAHRNDVLKRVEDRIGASSDRGFPTFGYFLQKVKIASSAAGMGSLPTHIQNALTASGSESVGIDGGFAVPPDFVPEVVRLITADDALLQMTDMRTTTSSALTIPKDETTPWQTSGGIQVLWENELAQASQSKPNLESS